MKRKRKEGKGSISQEKVKKILVKSQSQIIKRAKKDSKTSLWSEVKNSKGKGGD